MAFRLIFRKFAIRDGEITLSRQKINRNSLFYSRLFVTLQQITSKHRTMMKRHFLFALCLLAGIVTGVALLTSCGDDDDDNNGGGGGGAFGSKRVVKTMEEYGKSIYESFVEYDGQGRVLKITEKKNNVIKSVQTYAYGSVSVQVLDEDYDSNGKVTDRETTHFTLENGRVVSMNEDVYTCTYTYNAEGYMTSITETSKYSTPEVKQITWENGNMTRIGERRYEYSSIPWSNAVGFYLKGTEMYAALVIDGLYGKMPRFMPSLYYRESSTGATTYSYELTGGLITQITIDDYDDKEVTTLTWE